MNQHLSKLISRWQVEGQPPQETFNWSVSKNNWIRTFPSFSEFLENKVPLDLGRTEVRAIFENRQIDIAQKFLVSMIWGYGNIGYGPYRVNLMLSQKNAIEILNHAYTVASEGLPKDAYVYLKENRIKILGPSFGTKYLSFCAPREVGAPIYDSYVCLWISKYAKKEFSSISLNPQTWNGKTYSAYWDWIKIHAEAFDCYPDEVEFVLFDDSFRRFG
jgi:hypothetical protein